MRYLATNVRIFKGTNSRGDYHWMSMQLFNDADPAANPTRLPSHYITLNLITDEFLKHTDALKKNEEGDWLEVDMSKIPDEGLTKHHLDNMNRELVTLDDWYQQLYTRDYTDANGVIHVKGSVRVGRNGLPLPPVNSLAVFVQYYEAETFENGNKVKKWVPVETKEEIARGILERGYQKLQNNIATAAAFEDEDDDEQPTQTDVEAKRKALEEELAKLK